MDDGRDFLGFSNFEIDYLKYIMPNKLVISEQIAEIIKLSRNNISEDISIVDLGCGTGRLTRSLFEDICNIKVIAIDDKVQLIRQLKRHHADEINNGQLSTILNDILSALGTIESDSISYIASLYVFHNFRKEYKTKLHKEIYRVLKPGGLFLNGDFFALDDVDENNKVEQERVKYCMKALIAINKIDYITKWAMHHTHDLNPNVLMYESEVFNELKTIGFKDIEFSYRVKNEGLLKCRK
ncbi:MAG TPA: class I SAM-dependent methyltransferase [Victivallales bacterium]|nr:class I SAM-dependent methyltransferase [Victivallales bacterium]